MTATGSGPFPAPARFDVVLRGYDRAQVEEHIAHLHGVLARMQSDLRAAHQQLARPAPPPPRQRPAEPPPDMVASFSERMQSMMKVAQAEAEEVRRKAKADAVQLEKQAHAQLAELKAQRDSLLGELARLRSEAGKSANQATALRSAAPSPHNSPAPHSSPAPNAPAQPRPAPLFESPPRPQGGQPPPEPPKPRSEPVLPVPSARAKPTDQPANAPAKPASPSPSPTPARAKSSQSAQSSESEPEATVQIRATQRRPGPENEPTQLLPTSARVDGPSKATKPPVRPNSPNGNGANGNADGQGKPAGPGERGQGPPRRSRTG